MRAWVALFAGLLAMAVVVHSTEESVGGRRGLSTTGAFSYAAGAGSNRAGNDESLVFVDELDVMEELGESNAMQNDNELDGAVRAVGELLDAKPTSSTQKALAKKARELREKFLTFSEEYKAAGRATATAGAKGRTSELGASAGESLQVQDLNQEDNLVQGGYVGRRRKAKTAKKAVKKKKAAAAKTAKKAVKKAVMATEKVAATTGAYNGGDTTQGGYMGGSTTQPNNGEGACRIPASGQKKDAQIDACGCKLGSEGWSSCKRHRERKVCWNFLGKLQLGCCNAGSTTNKNEAKQCLHAAHEKVIQRKSFPAYEKASGSCRFRPQDPGYCARCTKVTKDRRPGGLLCRLIKGSKCTKDVHTKVGFAHAIQANCPDGAIQSGGVWFTGHDKKGHSECQSRCMEWTSETVVTGDQVCGSFTGGQVLCTKAAVLHPNRMSKKAGVLVMKRLRCNHNHECAVFKAGLCINVGKDVWSSELNTKIKDLKTETLFFAKKASALLKKYKNALPSKYQCKDKWQGYHGNRRLLQFDAFGKMLNKEYGFQLGEDIKLSRAAMLNY